ncbi:UDP-N-acetylmuramoyl-L-alanine--D-glutamate ligase [Inediibacterium massiliense]|uniref:UDP-N-acetylmuramoyl-L-alanine--D-glutamate ligase n=1 Tax=Inediibacterium massiliense TaxID=1658111 RepID=UPI0006B4626A|nr:UDP-N-acetylmuramoyl-L-alanine--D-glutamate ligase [Inediibacterium massiliense]
MKLKDKKVLVVGLGTSGIPTVNTLIDLGAKVTVNDQKTKEELKEITKDLKEDKVDFILGKHPENMVMFDVVVLSPGVPTDLSFIQEAKKLGMIVIGELELAYRLCKGQFIAITGTNGKTTTTSLVGEIFKNAQKETYVVGNIGVAAVSKAQKASEYAFMITEVSSFQLESIIDFKPKIAAILNITPDHLNRHKTMGNYINAKANIFKNQNKDDILILNLDNSTTYDLKEIAKSKVIPFSRKLILDNGVFVKDEYIVVKEENKECERICKVDDLKIPGKHNLENALAAVAIAHFAGIDQNIIEDTLKSFMGVEHRIEFVDEIHKVRFVNDSKGTNPDAAMRAIEAMKSPIVLIAGGMDKGSDFTEFIQSFNGKVKHMILFGETSEKIKNTAVENNFLECSMVRDMEEAVSLSAKIAKEGDCVLLSPACASWDMYPSYEVRGRHFKESVKKLRG